MNRGSFTEITVHGIYGEAAVKYGITASRGDVNSW